MVLGGFGWFWVVCCFSSYHIKMAEARNNAFLAAFIRIKMNFKVSQFFSTKSVANLSAERESYLFSGLFSGFILNSLF